MKRGALASLAEGAAAKRTASTPISAFAGASSGSTIAVAAAASESTADRARSKEVLVVDVDGDEEEDNGDGGDGGQADVVDVDDLEEEGEEDEQGAVVSEQSGETRHDEDEDPADSKMNYRTVIAEAGGGAGAGGSSTCFATCGAVDDAVPGLSITGVGAVPLPLSAEYAQKIVAVAARSPFGRRDQTLLDETVRKSWQVEPDAIALSNPAFGRSVEAAAQSAAALLGVDGTHVRARLYKLLLYDVGAFFLPHRDSEKDPGMFATMVVILPSVYTGGELIVKHAGETLTFDVAKYDGAAYRSVYVAFYADCVHEVRPVTSGCRLALVYNIKGAGETAAGLPDGTRRVMTGGPSRPVAPVVPAAQPGNSSRLVRALKRWNRDQKGELRLAVLLNHQYTDAGLCISALKGEDRVLLSTMVRAAGNAGVDVFVANTEKYEVGVGEGGPPRRYYNKWDWEDDSSNVEMEEVTSVDYTITAHVPATPDPSEAATIGPNILREEEFALQEDAFADLDHDKQEAHATGNAGTSIERWYRRTAIVLIRRSQAVALGLRVNLNEGLAALKHWSKALPPGIDQSDLTTAAAKVLAAIRAEKTPASACANAVTCLEILLAFTGDGALPRALLQSLTSQPSEAFLPAIGAHLSGLVRAVGPDAVMDATRAALATLPMAGALVQLLAEWRTYGKGVRGHAQKSRIATFVKAAAAALAARPRQATLLPGPAQANAAPSHPASTASATPQGYCDAMLALAQLAAELGDPALTTQSLENGARAGQLRREHGACLVAAAGLLGWPAVGPVAVRMAEATLGSGQDATDAVLSVVSTLEVHSEARGTLLAITDALVNAIGAGRACMGDGVRPAPAPVGGAFFDRYRSPSTALPSSEPHSEPAMSLARLVVLLMRLAGAGDEAARHQLDTLTVHLTRSTTSLARVRFVLSEVVRLVARDAPEVTQPRTVDAPSSDHPPWVTIVLFVLRRLAAAVASLSPPSNWTIPWNGRPTFNAHGAASYVADVDAFLKDPGQRTLYVRANKDIRRTLHTMLEGCVDVTHVTSREGRPETLVISKRLESYRLLRERAGADLHLFKTLAAIVPDPWRTALPPLPGLPPAADVPVHRA